MKKFFLITFVVCSMTFAGFAQTHVNGYYRSNGIYVQPHTRSSPNSTNHDNYSTQGNANPIQEKEEALPLIIHQELQIMEQDK